MGVQLFPVFNKKVRDVMLSDGKTLARAVPDSPDDQPATLWPLAQFISSSPDDVEQFREELEELDLDVAQIMAEVEEKWFLPMEAVAVLDEILQRASSDENFLTFPANSRIRDPNDVIEELQNLREQLRVADQEGALFHLQHCL